MKDNIKPIYEKCSVGTIYQLKAGGTFYLRYQIDGYRHCNSLRTVNLDEARRRANDLIPTLQASTIDAIESKEKEIRQLATQAKRHLPLSEAWKKYLEHPEHAAPATVGEMQAYESTWLDFVESIGSNIFLNEITYVHAKAFADAMRAKGYAVDTHNRRIKRVRKVMDVLKEYRLGKDNPFAYKNLLRLEREEQNLGVRRLSFTRKQEAEILSVLSDTKHRVKNKPELKVVFIIGMYTGQRLKDCVLLRWNKIDLQNHLIHVVQFKTGKYVVIPIAPQLEKALQEALVWKTSDNAYVCPNVAERYNIVDKNGKCSGSGLVDIDVLRVIKWIGLKPSVKVEGRKKAVTVYGFHSLRHSFVSHCAEAGVPRAVVSSIVGADADVVGEYYTHVGTEAQQMAISAISGTIAVMTAQDKINSALKYLETIERTPIIEKIVRILTDGASNDGEVPA